MVDYSRWDSFDSSDSGDEVTTHEETTSGLSRPLGMARAREKYVRHTTRGVMRRMRGPMERHAQNDQAVTEAEMEQKETEKSLRVLEKQGRRLVATSDTHHQKAAKNLLFASEADIDAAHELLKKSERVRSSIAAEEATRCSLATSVEATRVRLNRVSVEHSSVGADLAEVGQHVAKETQLANEQARSNLRSQLRNNNSRVNAAPTRAALRDFCAGIREQMRLLATCEQTQAVIACIDETTAMTEEICRNHFLGCVECGAGAMALRPLAVCARCKLVHYCCRAHQLSGWSAHKAACKQQSVERALSVLELLIDAAERREASA